MLRLLFLLVLAYFVFRTARNLWRSITADGAPPAPPTPLGSTRPPAAEPPVRRVWDADVEEARYRDL